MDLPLRCRCGNFRGVAESASPDTCNRVLCYCDDCQAFAHFLERDDVLDAAGGSDILQMAPSRVRITQGREHVRCVRLSKKGLFRWYAGCCKTPIGNMAGPRIPFVGLIQPIIDHDAGGRSRDDAVGAPRAYVHGRFATGPLPAGGPPKAGAGFIAHTVRLMLGWWLGGKGASPFFDRQSRAPVSTPEVLAARPRRPIA